jgi:hypothetical protein
VAVGVGDSAAGVSVDEDGAGSSAATGDALGDGSTKSAGDLATGVGPSADGFGWPEPVGVGVAGTAVGVTVGVGVGGALGAKPKLTPPVALRDSTTTDSDASLVRRYSGGGATRTV